MALTRVIKPADIQTDEVYEQGLAIDFGINVTTTGSPSATFGHTICPPGERSQRHIHLNCEVAGYALAGNNVQMYGAEETYREEEQTAGEFYFVERGEQHCGRNENPYRQEVLFAYPGVASKDAAGTVFYEGPQIEETRHLMPAEPPANSQLSRTIHEADFASEEVAEGVKVEIAISADTCGSETVTMGRLTLQPGAELTSHRHLCEEDGYVIDGKIVLSEPGADDQPAETGAFYHVPAGTAHSIRNDGAVEARVVFLYPLAPTAEAIGTEAV